MGLRINTNVPALGANRQTRQATNLLNRTLGQLASAQRINRAADDAAGLAIAERFNSQIRRGQTEINNLQSGVNYAQTAEGGLETQQDAVQRIRELAVQASNGTLSDDQRTALNAEAQELIAQVDDAAQDTEYNGQQLLADDTTVDLGTEGELQVTTNQSTAASLEIDDIDLSTAEGAAAAVEAADAALNDISQNRSNLGAQINRFERAIDQRGLEVENAQAAESRIRDLDFAMAVIEQTRGQLLQQTGLAAMTQSNVTPQSALSLLGA